MLEPFNVKILTEDMLQPLLQQMYKMASYSTNTNPEMSPFGSRLIDNYVSAVPYAMPPHRI